MKNKSITAILTFILIFTASTQVFAQNVVTISNENLPKLQVVTANGNVVSDSNYSNFIDKNNKSILGAVNGGFFNSYYNTKTPLSYPDNCPSIYANLISNGQSINGGNGTVNAVLQSDGKIIIDNVSIKNALVINDETEIVPWGVNKYYDNDSAVSFLTNKMTLPVKLSSGATCYFIENNKVTKIENVETLMPSKADVLIVNKVAKETYDKWNSLPKINDNVVLKSTVTSSEGTEYENVNTLISGGRLIVKDFKNVCESSFNNEIKDPKQSSTSVAQRTVIGVKENGDVVLLTDSNSFTKIAENMIKLGVKDAVSLDGGASSMLYGNGKVITPAGRKLSNVIIIKKGVN